MLSWRLSTSLDAAFCVEAQDEALARYGAPDVFNTDQGAQFTGTAFGVRPADNKNYLYGGGGYYIIGRTQAPKAA